MLNALPDFPSPQQWLKFERELYDEAREALTKTRLPRYFPNAVVLFTIEASVVSARVKQQDFVLPSAN